MEAETTPARRGRGRPRVIEEDVVNFKTRMPVFVHSFLLQLAPVPSTYMWAVPEEVRPQISGRQFSASLLHEAALRSFLHVRPWETLREFHFSRPQAVTQPRKSSQDWIQINIRLPKDLADRIYVPDPKDLGHKTILSGLTKELGIPLATFLWSAAQWFIQRLGERKDLLRPSMP